MPEVTAEPPGATTPSGEAAAGDTAPGPVDATGWEGPLPDPVRQRVTVMAADALGRLDPLEVPPTLRRVATFAPSRRARAGATALAAALEADEAFRRRVAARVREAEPDLAVALDHGDPPRAADPVQVAAVAFVLRGPGWLELVRAADDAVRQRLADERVAAVTAALERADEEVARLRERIRTTAAAAEAEVAAARAELAEVRRALREQTGLARRAAAEAAELREALDLERATASARQPERDTELQRLRARLAEAEAALAAERRASREGRTIADRDARLLLDTLLGAARGLERELALPPVLRTPAEDVAAAHAGSGAAVDLGGGLAPDDPVLLDRLLGLPRAHLIVDAYNVTKTAYGGLPLADQRHRLVAGLAGLAARTSAEVTAVFDGAAVTTAPASWPRGVRVVFSEPGESADDLVLALVAAEPTGRVVVVASSDREVADGAVARGARSVPAATLARLLERG